jgi:hypothetical protein
VSVARLVNLLDVAPSIVFNHCLNRHRPLRALLSHPSLRHGLLICYPVDLERENARLLLQLEETKKADEAYIDLLMRQIGWAYTSFWIHNSDVTFLITLSAAFQRQKGPIGWLTLPTQLTLPTYFLQPHVRICDGDVACLEHRLHCLMQVCPNEVCCLSMQAICKPGIKSCRGLAAQTMRTATNYLAPLHLAHMKQMLWWPAQATQRQTTSGTPPCPQARCSGRSWSGGCESWRAGVRLPEQTRITKPTNSSATAAGRTRRIEGAAANQLRSA